MIAVEKRPIKTDGNYGQGRSIPVKNVFTKKALEKLMENKNPLSYFFFFDGRKVTYAQALSYLAK